MQFIDLCVCTFILGHYQYLLRTLQVRYGLYITLKQSRIKCNFLHTTWCITRFKCSQRLLNKFPPHLVDFIWFTDEKVFTIATPSNKQNDRLYARVQTRKRDVPAERLLRCHSTFSKSIMVSVGVSSLGSTSLHFVEPGVKVNGDYYCDVLLAQKLLPDMKAISEFFVFQQEWAPARRAHDTMQFLERETPMFISPAMCPANSPDLNPVDYKIWGVLQERV